MPFDASGWAPPPPKLPLVAKVLMDARAKIAERRNWTKMVTARNAQGRHVDPKSIYAVKWCAIGAVEAVTSHYLEAFALAALTKQLGGRRVDMFNDVPWRRHATVLGMFDRAIAAELAKEKTHAVR